MINIHNNSVKKRDSLFKWLKSRCDYSDDVFKDPGYSNFYKSHFNIIDNQNTLYADGDIDHELNIGYFDYIDPNKEKHPQDAEIEQFIDHVPIVGEVTLAVGEDNFIDSIEETDQTSETDSIDSIESEIKDKLTRHNIVILPGSNHSNANYLYKRLTIFADELGSYRVPFVQNDPKKPFTNRSKNLYIEIDKEGFYQFIRDLSAQ